MPDGALLCVLFRLKFGSRERLIEIRFDLGDRLRFIHKDGVLIVVEEGAVIKVDRPDDGRPVVRKEGLCMDEPRRELIDLHAPLDERHIVGTREPEGELFIGDMGRHYPHVHTAARRGDERLYHAVVNDEVGRHDPDIFMRGVQNIEVHVLAEVAAEEGNGPRAVGLDIAAVPEGFRLGNIVQKVVHLLLLQPELHQKERRQHLDARPLEAERIVLPIAERVRFVDVFIRDIEPARIGDPPVDDDDLSVVAVVMDSCHHRHKGVEFDAVDPLLAQFFIVPGAHFSHGADVVVHDAHLDPFLHLLFEDFENGIPEFSALDDEILDENELFGASEIFEKSGQKGFPRRKIVRFRPAVKHRRGLRRSERFTHRRPVPHLFRPLFLADAPKFDTVDLLPDFPITFPLPAARIMGREEDVEKDAEHIQYGDAEDPRDLGLGHHVAVRGMQNGDDHDQPAQNGENDRHELPRVRKVFGENCLANDDRKDDSGKKRCQHEDDDQRNERKAAEQLEKFFHGVTSCIFR